MDILNSVFTYIIDSGSTVFVPLIILVFGLIFGQKFGKAFRSALFVGMGLGGINLVLWNLLSPAVGPAASAFVERLGIEALEYVDVGWGLASGIAWAYPIVPLVAVVLFGVNIIMLALKLTKTLDIDFWNYWHLNLLAAFVYFLTDSVWLAVVAAVIYFVYLLLLADWCAPLVEKFWKLPGISIPHGSVLTMAWMSYLINKVLDMIPGLKDLEADEAAIRKRFGIFGEGPVMGFLVGLVLALLGGLELRQSLNTAMQVATGFLLMPMMIGVLVEGLMPLSEAAREFVQKRFAGAEIYLGLDAAVLMGQPSVLATGFLLVPYWILISTVLPGNQVFPIASLTGPIWYAAFGVAWAKGNIVKGFINGLITLPIVLWTATALAPILTQVAQAINFDMPSAGLGVTAVVTGAETPYLLIIGIVRALFGG